MVKKQRKILRGLFVWLLRPKFNYILSKPTYITGAEKNLKTKILEKIKMKLKDFINSRTKVAKFSPQNLEQFLRKILRNVGVKFDQTAFSKKGGETLAY